MRSPLALTLTAGVFATAAGVHAQAVLRLDAGLDGKVRQGRWAPLGLSATNRGDSVSGTVELTLPGARTAMPLELAAAANKRIEAVLIPQLADLSAGLAPDRAMAVLHEGNGGGREVARVQVPVKVLPEPVRLLAVCGESEGGLRFLEGVPLAEAGWSIPSEQRQQWQNGVTETAHLSPARMPQDEAGLDAADLLVIRAAAWQQLEPRQRRAVRQWTELGGRLLLCGDDPTGFQDAEARRLLPVQRLRAQPRAQLTSLPLPGREPIRAATGLVMTIAALPLPDARVALREPVPGTPTAAPLVVSRIAGFGTVLWLGFDPFRCPPRRMEGRRALWAFLISQATGSPAPERAFPDLTDVPAAAEPAESLPRFPTPSRWALIALGVLYVLVFGPLHLWLLRRLRRTVRAWLLMPGLSVLLTGAVLGLGAAWGQARVVFHAVAVVEAMAGSGTGREQCLAALFSPASRRFALEVDTPAPLVRFLPVPGSAGSRPLTAPPSAPTSRPAEGMDAPAPSMPDQQAGQSCRWDRIGLTLWTLLPIQADLAADLGAGVRLDLDDGLAGQVVNGTPLPLQDAYLQFRGWRQPLGELAPGISRTVSASGWQRAVTRGPAVARSEAAGGIAGKTEPRPGTPASSEGGTTRDNLLSIAGSLLRPNTRELEVVLAARMASLAPPIRIPGVPRSGAPGLEEGTLLLIRKPVPPTAGLPRHASRLPANSFLPLPQSLGEGSGASAAHHRAPRAGPGPSEAGR